MSATTHDERRQATEEVRRFAEEMGVSVGAAWAERAKWEAEQAITYHEPLARTAEATVERLQAELRVARQELARHRRSLAAAERKRDKASAEGEG